MICHVPVRRKALYALATVAWLVGCQLIVSSDVPDYRCTGADPSSCPSGMICNSISLLCVLPGPPERDDGEAPPETDAGSGDAGDGGASLADLGKTCVVDGDCKDGLLCGTATVLTTAVVEPGSKPICTKPCCTSAECATGFVCFPAGTGGNYCVSAATAQRTPPATAGKTPGQSCAGATECRSGLCTGRCQDAPTQACNGPSDCDAGVCTGQRCNDSCCKATDCAAGSTCRVATVATHVVWACGAPNPGGKELDAGCNLTTECKNDNCVTGDFPKKRCTPSCCRASDCTSLGFTNNACAYGGTGGNDQIKWCFEPISGARALGVACEAHTDCLSRYCDAELRKCAAACCTTEDCPAEQSCRPSPVGTPYLRCVKNAPPI